MTPPRADKIIALLQEKISLEPTHRRLFYLVFGILWLSGAVWLAAEWLKEPDLGPARTPLQTTSMKIHGAAMLAYVAFLGFFWTHVRRGFVLRANRLSGLMIIALNLALLLSSWVLYYIADTTLREWNSMLHWSVGLALLPFLFGHILWGRRQNNMSNTEDQKPRVPAAPNNRHA